MATRTAKRVAALLEKRGRSLEPNDAAKLALEQPALASCYSAAAEGKVLLGERAAGRRSVSSGPRTCEPTSPPL